MPPDAVCDKVTPHALLWRRNLVYTRFPSGVKRDSDEIADGRSLQAGLRYPVISKRTATLAKEASIGRIAPPATSVTSSALTICSEVG